MMKSSAIEAVKVSRPFSKIFNRYYWLQIGLIALSIIIGLTCSAWIIKGSLLKTALEQEMQHYWMRVERDPNAPLPDTKNLYGYRWTTQVPSRFQSLELRDGVHRIHVDGKERMTVYGERNGQHVLLVFGESNVNKLIWLFGLAPLMFSLIVLYSFLWWSKRRAHRYFSPITRLAQTLEHIDWEHQLKQPSPFQAIDTNGNLEAEYLKQALEQYHAVLMDFIRREREFTGDVSHELRTPLTILRGNVQLCQARYGHDRALTRLSNTIEDMELLVDTLLAIARNNTQMLTAEQTKISMIMTDLVHDLTPVGRSKGIEISYTIEEQEQNRLLYPSMSKMVFSNILRNALNYSQGASVQILQKKNQILIADDGIGIELPHDSKVTELSETQSLLKPKGHGIGLQLVQKLCKQLGWRVELFDREYYLSIHPELQLAATSGLIVVVYLAQD